MVIEKIVLSESQPESQFVLWVRPVKGGYAAYVYGKRGWHPLKDIADNGTATTDDDELIDLSDVMKDLAEYKGLVSTQFSGVSAQLENMNSSLGNKVDKVAGKQLSTNDYTNEDRAKLASIAEGAGGNVQADWNATDGEAEILNKPTTLSGYGITDAKIEDGTVILGEGSIKPLTEHQDISQLALKTEIPTKTSQLSNDSSYQTGDDVQAAINSAVGDITGYAKSEDVYTKKEIDTSQKTQDDRLDKLEDLTKNLIVHVTENVTRKVSGSSDFTPWENKTVHVTYNGETTDYITDSNGQVTFDIQIGQKYTVAVDAPSAIGDYGTVDGVYSHDYTATSEINSSESHDWQFGVNHITETVTKIEADASEASVWSGATVHVKYNNTTTDYTTDSNGQVTFDIPLNGSYTVSMDKPSDAYIAGSVYSHTYTASTTAEDTATHSWAFTEINDAEIGVHVIATDGTESTLADFQTAHAGDSDKGKSQIGLIKIATKNLIVNGGVFYLDPAGIHEAAKAEHCPITSDEYSALGSTYFKYSDGLQWKNKIKWAGSNVQFGQNTDATADDYIPMDSSDPRAKYWNGLAYTKAIIKYGDDKNIETPAADFAYRFTVENNGHTYQGFLPSMSQLKTAWDNTTAVDAIIAAKYEGDDDASRGLATLFGKNISNYYRFFWSSVQRDSNYAWLLIGTNGYYYDNTKPYSDSTRLAGPFFAY